MKLFQRVFFWRYSPPIYAAVHHGFARCTNDTVQEGLTKFMKEICFFISKRMTRGISESLHADINRARLTACEVGFFITILKNTLAPLFEEPLKFFAHGHIFRRLWYIVLQTFHSDKENLHSDFEYTVYCSLNMQSWWNQLVLSLCLVLGPSHCVVSYSI